VSQVSHNRVFLFKINALQDDTSVFKVSLVKKVSFFGFVFIRIDI